MSYKKNRFHIEGVPSEKIAKKFGTPTYCYSYKKLRENIINFKKYFKSFRPMICFSIKSNSNVNLLKEIKKFGLGADVVSLGEIMKAQKAGINVNKIVFSGVGKTTKEINYAINKNIFLINAESQSEIIEIERIAKSQNKVVNIGIRLNPDTNPRTLKKISTGKKENKFGVDEKTFIKLVDYIKRSDFINLKCLSVHIGSQILNHKPYEKMLKVLDRVIKKSKYQFEYIDLGGGMGIPYEKKLKKLDYNKYNFAINKFLKAHKSKIIFEPGRSIIGNTGFLISKIIFIKDTKTKKFIIIDAGMNDFMRPALYNAKHNIVPSVKKNIFSKIKYEFVGPICETTDKFSSFKKFQKLNEKDIIVICDVGAYGVSLSSNYNVRPKPLELLIKGSKILVIKRREKLEDII